MTTWKGEICHLRLNQQVIGRIAYRHARTDNNPHIQLSI